MTALQINRCWTDSEGQISRYWIDGEGDLMAVCADGRSYVASPEEAAELAKVPALEKIIRAGLAAQFGYHPVEHEAGGGLNDVT